jgi:hypothetical protein
MVSEQPGCVHSRKRAPRARTLRAPRCGVSAHSEVFGRCAFPAKAWLANANILQLFVYHENLDLCEIVEEMAFIAGIVDKPLSLYCST